MGVFQSKPTKTTKQPHTKQSAISDIDRAILDLKNARDRLTKYRAVLDTDSQRLLNKATECKSRGRNKLAIGLLRLRRERLHEVGGVESQILTVMQMVSTVRTKEEEGEVMNALRGGKDALKKLHEQTGLEDVLKLLDDIVEENEIEKEVGEALGRLGEEGITLTPEGEVEIEAEFAALEAEIANVEELPEAPTKAFPVVKPIDVEYNKKNRLTSESDVSERVAVTS